MRVSQRSIRRVLRRAAVVAAACATIALIALWLAFQHKPAWYRPVALDEAGLQRARRDLTNLTDWIGDQLVRREPFDLILKQPDVNVWLTALPHIWPETATALDPPVTRPAIAFGDTGLHIGAELASGGWRVIASVEVSLSVTDNGDGIVVLCSPPYGGSLPIPRALIDPTLARLLQRARPRASSNGGSSTGLESLLREVRTVDELFRGIRTGNRFVWPNGRRPFRIAGLTFSTAELAVHIEPL